MTDGEVPPYTGPAYLRVGAFIIIIIFLLLFPPTRPSTMDCTACHETKHALFCSRCLKQGYARSLFPELAADPVVKG